MQLWMMRACLCVSGGEDGLAPQAPEDDVMVIDGDEHEGDEGRLYAYTDTHTHSHTGTYTLIAHGQKVMHIDNDEHEGDVRTLDTHTHTHTQRPQCV